MPTSGLMIFQVLSGHQKLVFPDHQLQGCVAQCYHPATATPWGEVWHADSRLLPMLSMVGAVDLGWHCWAEVPSSRVLFEDTSTCWDFSQRSFNTSGSFYTIILPPLSFHRFQPISWTGASSFPPYPAFSSLYLPQVSSSLPAISCSSNNILAPTCWRAQLLDPWRVVQPRDIYLSLFWLQQGSSNVLCHTHNSFS